MGSARFGQGDQDASPDGGKALFGEGLHLDRVGDIGHGRCVAVLSRPGSLETIRSARCSRLTKRDLPEALPSCLPRGPCMSRFAGRTCSTQGILKTVAGQPPAEGSNPSPSAVLRSTAPRSNLSQPAHQSDVFSQSPLRAAGFRLSRRGGRRVDHDADGLGGAVAGIGAAANVGSRCQIVSQYLELGDALLDLSKAGIDQRKSLRARRTSSVPHFEDARHSPERQTDPLPGSDEPDPLEGFGSVDPDIRIPSAAARASPRPARSGAAPWR